MIIPTAYDCIQAVSSTSTGSAYYLLALSQIASALSSGAYSCTLTTSGKDVSDVRRVMESLSDQGFRLTQSGVTITILWNNSAPAVAILY